MEDFLYIGRVAKPHGVRGEIKVFPTTDNVRRYDNLDYVYIELSGKDIKYSIVSVKYVGKFVVLKLDGINTVEDTLSLRNAIVKIEKSRGIALDDDEYYYSDLIGMEVIADGEVFGVVENIIRTGSNDVYEVRRDNKDLVLLPAIKECILDVDLEKMLMTVHIMDGLL